MSDHPGVLTNRPGPLQVVDGSVSESTFQVAPILIQLNDDHQNPEP